MKLISLLLTATVLSLALPCCKPTLDSDPYWDEASATYFIPQDSLSFHFGTLANDWIILDPDSLPENMELCAIDPDRDICLMLISPTEKSFAELTISDKHDIVQEICHQQNPLVEHSQPEFLEAPTFTKFRQGIRIPSQKTAERTEVAFTGYIFNRNNRAKVLISTIPKEMLDSLGEMRILGSIYSGISAYSPI